MPLTISKAAVITEPGNTTRNKTGNWRSQRPVRDESKCTKCHLCWLTCPDNAISEDIKFNYDYCKGCGICARQCLVKCIAMQPEEK